MVAQAEDAAAAKTVDDDCQVFEDNWLAVTTFCTLATQWKLLLGAADVLYVGLDYGAVETVFRLEQVPAADWRAVFQDLRVMERAALPLLNERS
ncbi:DUF1799 domain-containing protein [Pseudoduganella sp. HUAS MS19]